MSATPQTTDLPMKLDDEQLSLSLDILDSATFKASVPYDVEYVISKTPPFQISVVPTNSKSTIFLHTCKE